MAALVGRSAGQRVKILAVAIAMSLTASACAAGGAAAPAVVRLSAPIVISVVKNQSVQLAMRYGANRSATQAVGAFASVLGTFAFDQIEDALFDEDDSWYIIIHHWIDDEPATSVVEIRNDSELGITIDGGVDIYPFPADRKFIFDALRFEDTEITVFNRETGFETSADGTIELPASGTAYDLESALQFNVADPEFLPVGADLYFDETEHYANLVNGAGAVSRHGIVPALDLCNSLPDSAWRTNLVPSNVPDLAEAWCVRTAEGQYASVEVADGDLFFRVWID